MTKAKSNSRNNIRFNYFVELFIKSKRSFPISYFLFNTGSRKKMQTVSKKLFENIITTYLDVYFNEFYYHDKPKYFPLSGEIVKTAGRAIPENKFERCLTWIWYLRPTETFFSNVRLGKLKGSYTKLDKLDRNYKIDHDIAVLPVYRTVLNDLRNNNKLYKL